MSDHQTLTMRPVQPEDVPALHQGPLADRTQIEVEALVQGALRLARTRRGVGVVAVQGGVIVGFGMLTLWRCAAEIGDLTVTPARRGRGIGTAIIDHLSECARAMHAERLEIGAHEDNVRALALYRRLGFVETRTLDLDTEQSRYRVLYMSKTLR